MMRILYDVHELDSIDANLVAEASNRLEVGEFQFFQLGYAAWYGTDADTKTLERTFFAYLLTNTTPPWARHYARHIIQMDDEGDLEPYAPEYHRFDSTAVYPHSRSRGAVKVFAILVTIVLLFIGMYFSARAIVPEGVFCLYPPCYWSEEPQQAAPEHSGDTGGLPEVTHGGA